MGTAHGHHWDTTSACNSAPAAAHAKFQCYRCRLRGRHPLLRCYICGKLGHAVKVCRNNQQIRGEAQESRGGRILWKSPNESSPLGTWDKFNVLCMEETQEAVYYVLSVFQNNKQTFINKAEDLSIQQKLKRELYWRWDCIQWTAMMTGLNNRPVHVAPSLFSPLQCCPIIWSSHYLIILVFWCPMHVVLLLCSPVPCCLVIWLSHTFVLLFNHPVIHLTHIIPLLFQLPIVVRCAKTTK